jgi:hypothetical protein
LGGKVSRLRPRRENLQFILHGEAPFSFVHGTSITASNVGAEHRLLKKPRIVAEPL